MKSASRQAVKARPAGWDGPTVCIGEPTRLRVSVYSDATHTDHRHVLVFDGKPDEGGTLIAAKLVHGIDADDGSSVWIDWTPTEGGAHDIYAELVENHDDTNPGNSVAVLTVNVVERSPDVRPFAPVCGFGIQLALGGTLLGMGLLSVPAVRRRVRRGPSAAVAA